MLKKLLGIDKLEQENKKLRASMQDVKEQNKDLQTQLEDLQDVRSPKDIATENGEPWISVLDTKFDDPETPGKGYFELDYNSIFVETLKSAGYSGRTDDDVVDMWFNDLCRGIIGE